jgi:predicted acetyltransferase
VEPAPVTTDEVPALLGVLRAAFHQGAPPAWVERVRPLVEPERTLAIRDGDRLVAVAGIYSRTLTIPGGETPLAAVTLVGVLPSHRRRGLLTRLMRRQLADIHEAGREAVAALWASEAVIYGRFGYGCAALVGELDVASRDARLASVPTAPVELLAPTDALPAMRAIHEIARGQCPGMLDRDDGWWRRRVDDPESDRQGAGPLSAAVVEGSGYALYAVKPVWEGGRPGSEVMVREVIAVDPEGSAAVWNYLLGLDLTRRVLWSLGPPDDPLPYMVTEAQAVGLTLHEALWVRLVDIPRALAERTYSWPFEVVLEVADDVCPWNAGRWALRWDGTAATCRRTSLPAALELGAAELGAAYLGGTTLDQLARAGRVRELRPGTLSTVSKAFRGERAPWCPEIF